MCSRQPCRRHELARPAGDTAYPRDGEQCACGRRGAQLQLARRWCLMPMWPPAASPLRAAAPQAGQAAHSFAVAQPARHWLPVAQPGRDLQPGRRRRGRQRQLRVACSAAYDVVVNRRVCHGASGRFIWPTPRPPTRPCCSTPCWYPAPAVCCSSAAGSGWFAVAAAGAGGTVAGRWCELVALFQQAGQQSGTTSNFGETGFSTKTISLAPYAGRTIRPVLALRLQQWQFLPAGLGRHRLVRGRHHADRRGHAGRCWERREIASPAFSFTGSSCTVLLQAQAEHVRLLGTGRPRRTVSVSAGRSVHRRDCTACSTERNHLALFAPSGAASTTSAPYYYRFYAGTQASPGVPTVDGNVPPGRQPAGQRRSTGQLARPAGCTMKQALFAWPARRRWRAAVRGVGISVPHRPPSPSGLALVRGVSGSVGVSAGGVGGSVGVSAAQAG